MSASASVTRGLPAAAGARPLASRLAARDSLPLRLAAFAGLAWLGAAQWTGLIDGAQEGRALGAVAIATAGGAALAALGHRRVPRVACPAAAVAVVRATAAAACMAMGLSGSLLAPAHWDSLGDGLDRGLVGASSTGWPYVGDDPWVRLTLMLGVPALLVPTMALAFWPARLAAGARRGLALVLLVVLFAVPATELSVGDPLGRGALLLLLIAAWLWLPRLRGRDLLPGLAVLAAAAAVALPLASAARSHQPWVDYTTWNLFSGHGNGKTFDWVHRYGPLSWSRTGDTLLDIRSPHSHYWKAETLDRFDGLRWSHSDAGANSSPAAELPAHRNPRWDERIRFTVRGLKTDFLIGAGTTYSIDGDRSAAGSADGTIRLLDGPLGEGDSYTVVSYVPDPSAAQMRAAPRVYPTQFLTYTYFDLPRPDDSALTGEPPSEHAGIVTPRTIGAQLPGRTPGEDPFTRRRILSSPYARTYELARRLAAGQATQYDVVKRVQDYLERGFSYDERPPLRRYPLEAFLFRDKVGYCQQFSGAMALLLRMNGIPARVAGGFAPGVADKAGHEYRVSDLDAHSWVEVWFTGIGWVPFDPTPSAAPASAQSNSLSSPSAATGGHESGADAGGKRARPDAPARLGPEKNATHVWALVLALLALPTLGAGALWAFVGARTRRLRRAGGDPDLRELDFALERLGYAVPAGTTLLELERRLGVTAGAGAVAYVRALRGRRFMPAGQSADTRLDRRGLRRGLAEGRGPIVKLRALLALPPWRHA
ncbi:MAG: protein-glutamine gamma-glutamyltransferase [Thermoleophilaceae bacterium]|nr:protein-glutamine gamma-glutamyltransferase [Thermoleophilaceae bacterium]